MSSHKSTHYLASTIINSSSNLVHLSPSLLSWITGSLVIYYCVTDTPTFCGLKPAFITSHFLWVRDLEAAEWHWLRTVVT